MPTEEPPFIYEIHCFRRETPEDLQSIFQGYADTGAEAIATGRTTLEVGHPDPAVIARWKAEEPGYENYVSPWGRVVVYWAQFRPADYYQDISDTKPVADLRETNNA